MTAPAQERSPGLQRALKGRCLYLMLSLLALLLVYPFFQGGPVRESAIVLLNSVTLAGVYAVSETTRHLILSLLIGVPQMALAWTAFIFGHSAAQTPSVALLVVFYGWFACWPTSSAENTSAETKSMEQSVSIF